MISYCWGPKDEASGLWPTQEKAKRIKAAIEELPGWTSSVWMDIEQMRGGDDTLAARQAPPSLPPSLAVQKTLPTLLLLPSACSSVLRTGVSAARTRRVF